MAKWYGNIGFASFVEIAPGIRPETITERPYFGDVIRNTRSLQGSGEINDNVVVNNQISVVADPYATDHIYDMRYVEWLGSHWKVSSVDVQYPRLILSLGGLYTDGK